MLRGITRNSDIRLEGSASENAHIPCPLLKRSECAFGARTVVRLGVVWTGTKSKHMAATRQGVDIHASRGHLSFTLAQGVK